jgi:acyl-[acyl carrier protein]--UDP-N-acetylglucosamine O-acyltransferase
VVNDNNALTSLTGLEGLTSIGEDLMIYHNDALTNLTGLENVTSTGGDLEVNDNNALISLTGLDNVTSIGEGLEVNDNNALISLTGLDNVISIGEDLEVNDNDALTSLTGLDNVTSIGEYLRIWENNALTSLTGLEGLTSIGGELWVDNNNALTNLTGLDNVDSIGGDLKISYNNALTSLSGLDNIDAGSISNITISFNNSLAFCEVQSICNYLVSPNGTIFIYGNATGCNSQEEVEEACGIISVEDLNVNEDFLVSPNPFTTTTTLSYTLSKPSSVIIRIFNSQGQKVDEIVQDQLKGTQQVLWNAEGLPAGIYYYRIQAGEQVGGGKMVKMK